MRFRLYTLQLTGQSLTFVTQVTHCYFCVVATSDNSFWPFSPPYLTISLRQSGIFYYHEHLYHAKFVVLILCSMHE